mmetsp:Transcript_123246/g.343115  ORF Transcript_123246/g.343115 Transcript_123246/m.343115 type:complete len:224 (-) Transcript_123246:63-734(-)
MVSRRDWGSSSSARLVMISPRISNISSSSIASSSSVRTIQATVATEGHLGASSASKACRFPIASASRFGSVPVLSYSSARDCNCVIPSPMLPLGTSVIAPLPPSSYSSCPSGSSSSSSSISSIPSKMSKGGPCKEKAVELERRSAEAATCPGPQRCERPCMQKGVKDVADIARDMPIMAPMRHIRVLAASPDNMVRLLWQAVAASYWHRREGAAISIFTSHLL